MMVDMSDTYVGVTLNLTSFGAKNGAYGFEKGPPCVDRVVEICCLERKAKEGSSEGYRSTTLKGFVDLRGGV